MQYWAILLHISVCQVRCSLNHQPTMDKKIDSVYLILPSYTISFICTNTCRQRIVGFWLAAVHGVPAGECQKRKIIMHRKCMKECIIEMEETNGAR